VSLTKAESLEAEQVLRFARKWGILGLCPENLPVGHDGGPLRLPSPPRLRHSMTEEPAAGARVASPREHVCGVVRFVPPPPEHVSGGVSPAPAHPAQGYDFSEPVVAWLHYAGILRLILRIAATIQLDTAKARDDERHAWGALLGDKAPPRGQSLEERQRLLAELVRECLRLGNVRARFELSPAGDTPVLSLGENLFGILAVQLALLVGRVDGLATCAACDRPIITHLTSQSSRRTYCQHCRDRQVPGKLAVRRHRQRIRQAARAGGATPSGQASSAREDAWPQLATMLVSDALWARVAPIIAAAPEPEAEPEAASGARRGRPVLISARAALTGILYVLWRDAGNRPCGWDGMPPALGSGHGRTCERRLTAWKRRGLWRRLLPILQAQFPAGMLDWTRAAGPDTR